MYIYLSGAITGIPNYREIFRGWSLKLKSKGYEVISPIDILDYVMDQRNITKEDLWKPETRSILMREDLKAMLDCDAIFMIPGWESSKGANLELQTAKGVGMQVIQQEDLQSRD